MRDLLVLSVRRSVALYASDVVWRETERYVRRKSVHGLPFLAGLRASGIIGMVDPPESLIQRVATLVVDKDAPIVAAAITADVEWLVTYDRKHLLRQAQLILAEYGIAVVTPDELVRSL